MNLSEPVWRNASYQRERVLGPLAGRQSDTEVDLIASITAPMDSRILFKSGAKWYLKNQAGGNNTEISGAFYDPDMRVRAVKVGVYPLSNTPDSQYVLDFDEPMCYHTQEPMVTAVDYSRWITRVWLGGPGVATTATYIVLKG